LFYQSNVFAIHKERLQEGKIDVMLWNDVVQSLKCVQKLWNKGQKSVLSAYLGLPRFNGVSLHKKGTARSPGAQNIVA